MVDRSSIACEWKRASNQYQQLAATDEGDELKIPQSPKPEESAGERGMHEGRIRTSSIVVVHAKHPPSS